MTVGVRKRNGGAAPAMPVAGAPGGALRRPPVGSVALATCALALALALALGCRAPDAAAPPLSLAGTLGGADTAGYARALEPRPFDFPADHGPHPDFRSEWWYVTGNLDAESGRRFGFQLTLFRSALSPAPREGSSAWGTRQAYMAHFALADVEGGTFHAFERFARGALGLAGASADPFRVWLEDWSLSGPAEGGGPFPMTLRAAEGDVAVELLLERGKPPVLQGDRGLSRKGPEAGNASYYYSFTRMPASGRVVLGADTVRASGAAWLDREWSTSALSEGQVGWDWFALQLDGDRELMVYRLRRADGTAHPLSEGVLVDPAGGSRRLSWGSDVTVEETGRWTSPRTGARYPSGWRIGVPSEGWRLDVEPVLAGQELDLTFRYWEGAVRVGGSGPQGRGYVELTGYGGAPLGR